MKTLAAENKKIQDLDLLVKEIIDNSKNKSYEILNEKNSQIELLEKKLQKKFSKLKKLSQI